MTELETDCYINELVLQQIKEKYPDFKLVSNKNAKNIDNNPENSEGLKGFLYSKRYRDFNAEFYVNFMNGAYLGANIYDKEQFQYSISTNSGEWKERLDYLEKIVNNINEKGFSSVRTKFNSGNLSMSFDEF